MRARGDLLVGGACFGAGILAWFEPSVGWLFALIIVIVSTVMRAKWQSIIASGLALMILLSIAPQRTSGGTAAVTLCVLVALAFGIGRLMAQERGLSRQERERAGWL